MKPTSLAGIALVSALLTPIVVGAVSTKPTLSPRAQPAWVDPGRSEEPACLRKVKVVYAGYTGAGGCEHR